MKQVKYRGGRSVDDPSVSGDVVVLCSAGGAVAFQVAGSGHRLLPTKAILREIPNFDLRLLLHLLLLSILLHYPGSYV